MRCFTDNQGRQWTLNVTIGALKRVRAMTGLDLYRLVEVDDKGELDAEVLKRLASDPILLVDTLYSVCKPEADSKGITDEQFGEAMAGDAIADATNALLDEVTDFFPEARRKALKTILSASRAFEAKETARLNREIEDGLEARIISAMESASASPGK